MPLADNATGDEAALKKEEAVWTADLRERRGCKAADGALAPAGGGTFAENCQVPKYRDYVVTGNMVLPCQGDTVQMSRDNCATLLAQMP